MKTVDFLDAVKAAYLLTSDYQLAKKLAVTQSSLSHYRSGRSFMDDSMALKIANLLDLDPLQVMACAHVEREERSGSEDLLNFWRGVAKNLEVNRLTFATSAA